MTIASTATAATAMARASARTMSSMTATRLTSASSSSAVVRSAAAPTFARHCHSHTTAARLPSLLTTASTSSSSSLSRLQLPSRPFCSATAPRRDAGNHDEQRSGGGGTPIGQIEQRLSLTFTCAVEGCGHRSSHEFAKRSYEKGIVIVQCPECKNRHLIADHLSWFKDSHEAKTVEEMVKEKGGRVRTGRKVLDDGQDQGETVEILSDSDADIIEAAREG